MGENHYFALRSSKKSAIYLSESDLAVASSSCPSPECRAFEFLDDAQAFLLETNPYSWSMLHPVKHEPTKKELDARAKEQEDAVKAAVDTGELPLFILTGEKPELVESKPISFSSHKEDTTAPVANNTKSLCKPAKKKRVGRPSGKTVPKSGYSIYTDGSFGFGRGAWSFVVYKNGKEIHHDSGIIEDPACLKLHNVAGEIRAAMEAVLWAESKKIKSYKIYCDYDGVRKWVSGEWNAGNPVTQEYRDFMQERLPSSVKFVRVQGHSGNAGNERADRLAKETLRKG